MSAEYLALDAGPEALGVPHGFFTRRGGVSEGPFASLNCSLSSADDPARVAENRARVARAMAVAPDRLVGVQQVHGVVVARVGLPWPAGQGPAADALVTARPGVALGVITADCAPVLFADPSAGVVGAAHAGWRGAVAGVLEATLREMVALGAAPARVRAAIGPRIGQQSYEVGADLRSAVLAGGSEHDAWFAPGRRPGHWQFDLGGYCAARLRRIGLASIALLPADTAAEPERFFSHRRRTLSGGGPIGHQISVVSL